MAWWVFFFLLNFLSCGFSYQHQVISSHSGFLSSTTCFKSNRRISMREENQPKLYGENFGLKSANPGFGGYWPGSPDAKKYNVTIILPKSADGSQKPALSLMVPEDRYIYFYFEEMGVSLPFINVQRMCRQGCCTICTAKVLNSKPNEVEEPFNNKAKVKMDSPLGPLSFINLSLSIS